MKTVEQVAGKITDYFPKDDKAAIDPLTLLMIISVIISFIRMMQACNKSSSDVKDVVTTLSDKDKRRAKREIRRALGLKDMRFGRQLYDSVLQYGKDADTTELESLFNEIT